MDSSDSPKSDIFDIISYHGSDSVSGREAKLERKTKFISDASNKQYGEQLYEKSADSGQSVVDEPERSSHDRDELPPPKLLPGRWMVEEKDRNQVLTNSRLPGPDSLGITRDAWKATEPSSGVVHAQDSVPSVTLKDQSKFACSGSPPPSSFLTARGKSYTDTALEQATGNDGVSAYPRILKNAPNAANVCGCCERHGEHKEERLHKPESYLLAGLVGLHPESAISTEFSDLGVTSKPLLENTIFEYPGPAMHLQLPIPIPIPSNEKKRSDLVPRSNNAFVVKSRVYDRERKGVSERSGDAAPVVTRGAPRRLAANTERSGYSDREASRSPERRYPQKKQEVGRAKVVAPPTQGQLRLSPQTQIPRYPDVSLPELEPPDGGWAQETHASVQILGKQSSESDSEEELKHEDNKEGVQSLTFPWTKGDLLGTGSFGTVYEAVDSNGSLFAVKEVSLIDIDNDSQCVSQLEQEIQLLSGCRHKNLVQYFSTQRENGKLYIFMELVSRVSFASLCKKFKFTSSQVVACTRQILKGIKYLHTRNVVHRNIKCANILVDGKGTCKLGDFGFAKQISALDQLKSCKDDVYWMAPEVTDPNMTYWHPADIWSLGCSVIEMFTGSTPFQDQEWDQVLLKLAHGEAPPIPEHLSDDAKDFLGQCLNVNPTKRPTARALLQHKFLSTKIGGGPLLSDWNWGPTASAGGNSGAGAQSPRLTTPSEEKIQEQPHARRIEAESIWMNRIEGESYHRGVEGERKNIAMHGKKRAHTRNLTKSGLVEHMTPSIRQKDVTMDLGVPTDSGKAETSCAQVEAIPVNLIDPISAQRELNVTSNTLLRPDVLALGFQSFNHEFDAERVLCIYDVWDSQDAVEILFFHVEGMALLFGVGLSFSRVLLRKGAVVEVKQLKQQVWMESWSESEMSKFSLILLNSSTVSAPTSGFESTPRNTVQALSPEQAAEQFGVGLEGVDSYIRMGEFQRDVSNATAMSPAWITSLYDFLRCRDHEAEDSQEKEMVSEHNLGIPLTTIDLSLPSTSGSVQESTLHENHQRSQGQELPEVTSIERGMQNQPLHLTIIVYLDPEDCTFYSAVVGTEMRLDRKSGNRGFVHCETGEVLPIVDPALCEFLMEPKVTINFWYYPYLEGSGSKKVKTTLDANFLIEGEVSDPDKFGWYHDRLRLSFKCTRPNAVRREPRETEILSKHEIRTADRGYARGNSTAALEGNGKEYRVFAGFNTLASLQIGSISKKENTVGSGENQELFAKISAVCLVDANFSIRKVERRSELAYLATIFPSFHLYNVWNSVDRDHAHNSGMMSAVRVEIEGDWNVREDEDDNLYTSDSPADSSDRFCSYEFSCQRELKLLRRSHVGRVNQVERHFFPIFRNPEQELIWETEEKFITLQQKLVRKFLVNHSFSHMQRLERPYAYVWDMVGRPQAPPPRPADQMLH